LKFLRRSSGRLENYDSSDLITAAEGSAQRSMSLGATSPPCGHKKKARIKWRRSTSVLLALRFAEMLDNRFADFFGQRVSRRSPKQWMTCNRAVIPLKGQQASQRRPSFLAIVDLTPGR
jgi:hypothetical protein